MTLTLDWPEEFARKQATFIGGTGYQYGDTDFVAYSEAIYADFAHQLRLGSGPVSIGQALVAAKQDYLAGTPSVDAIGQKAVYEAELYGLPMESINLPAGRLAAPVSTSVVSSTSPTTTDPGSTLGLRTATVTVTPHLTANSVSENDVDDDNAPVTATYDSGTNGTVVEPYQPVLPLESENVSVPGQSLRGAIFLGGSYTDTSGVTPLTGAPATEIRGVHTGFASTAFFPERTATINYYDALDGNAGGATRLMVTPEQHMSDPAPATTDTRRTFSAMSYRLFYSANTATYGSGSTTSTPAAATAPSIVNVDSTLSPDGSSIDICATIGAALSAGVQQAVVTYTDATVANPSWSSLPLTAGGCNAADDWSVGPSDSSSFGASIPLAGHSDQNIQFMVQAASGTGLVSVADNLGAFFTLPKPVDEFDTASFANLGVSSSTAPYGSSVTVSADGSYGQGGGDPLGSVPVVFTIGGQSVQATTDDNGHAQATIDLDLPPGSYPLGVAVNDPSFSQSSVTTPNAVTVTKQATLLTLAPTGGTLATGQTSYTATLCATDGSACDDTSPPVAGRTVVFTLSGPVTRTVALQTTVSGQARFDQYGLPPGDYTVTVHFGGATPGAAASTDSFYTAAAPASTEFSLSTTYSTPPTLQLPATINATTTAGSSAGVVVPFTVSATDPVDPHPSIVCTPGSVSFFPVGATTVRCTATDSSGNSTSGSFTVNITRNGSPTPVVVAVSGTQQFHAAHPTFSYTASLSGALTGALTCAKLSTGAAIGPNLAVGSYTINPASCSGLTAPGGAPITYTASAKTFLVTKAATTLTVAPAVRKLLAVTLSATLKRTDTGAPIAGQRVVFSVSGLPLCIANTNAQGVATCHLLLLVISLRPVYYTATYPGAASYLPGSGQAQLNT